MRGRQGSGLAEWLRRAVLGPYVDRIARLDGELARLQRTVSDPEALRPLVTEAFHREVQDAPAALVTALVPVVEELLRARSLASPPGKARRYWPWLTMATTAGAAGLLLLSWRGPAAMVSAATGRAPVGTDTRSVAAIIEEPPEHAFGLGQAEWRDEGLAHTVRERLSTCAEIASGGVQFSVKDGWVWLRGHATASGRDAAERALADLGGGVVVINQIAVTDAAVAAAR